MQLLHAFPWPAFLAFEACRKGLVDSTELVSLYTFHVMASLCIRTSMGFDYEFFFFFVFFPCFTSSAFFPPESFL